MVVEENLWSVQSSSGDIRLATIEQLAEAFRAGEIGDGALVRATDDDEWVKLTDLLAAQSLAGAGAAVGAPAAPALQDLAPPAPDTEIWQVRLAHGEVRTGTRHQLEEAVQVGHIDGNTMVLASGAREWVKLSSVFGPSEPSLSRVAGTLSSGAPFSFAAGPQTSPRPLPPDNDILQVRLPGGEVRSGTREQLDEAMQAGHIDGSALVLASGAREWVRLDSLPWLGQRISAPLASVLPAGAARGVAVGTAPHQGYAPPPSAGPQYASSPPGGVDEVWQVKLSRRQLETALRAGHLDESVLVLASGARDWVKLGSALSPAASTRPSTMAVSPTPSAQPRVQPYAATGPTDANRDVWQVKLANGEVRTGSRHQLVEALQAGHLDASALVLASGTTEWVKLGSLVESGTLPPPPVVPSSPLTHQRAPTVPSPVVARTEPPPGPANENDVWQVRLASGEVRSGTREQLEEAVRAGHLDPSSLVLAAGATEWVSLASVIERGPEDPTLSSVAASATSTAEWPAAEVTDAAGATGPPGEFISETTVVGEGIASEPPVSTEPTMEFATEPTPQAPTGSGTPDAKHTDDAEPSGADVSRGGL